MRGGLSSNLLQDWGLTKILVSGTPKSWIDLFKSGCENLDVGLPNIEIEVTDEGIVYPQ